MALPLASTIILGPHRWRGPHPGKMIPGGNTEIQQRAAGELTLAASTEYRLPSTGPGAGQLAGRRYPGIRNSWAVSVQAVPVALTISVYVPGSKVTPIAPAPPA